jgi:hypothetical protein
MINYRWIDYWEDYDILHNGRVVIILDNLNEWLGMDSLNIKGKFSFYKNALVRFINIEIFR